MRRTADVEVWAKDAYGPLRRLGVASTIRGIRQMIKRRLPDVKQVELHGTADALDRANGLSLSWSQSIDLVTRDVPIRYVIVKEGGGE